MLDEVAGWVYGPPGLTPHGLCLLWEPWLIWLHAMSDGATGLAYFTIPPALAILVRRRRDLVFRPVFILFGAFMALCGTGHWLDLLTVWVPAYGLEEAVMVATAAVAILSTATLWMLLPKALMLPSPAQFQEVNEALAERDHRALELSRLNADLEQFAYIASHDLKAPLHAIARLADWIGQDIQGIAGPETLENLHLMQQRAARLERLIASLLNYARAGHAGTTIEPIDVGDLVAEITGSIAPPLGFAVRVQGGPHVILTRRPPLEQVLRNLITNAIKHHDRPAGAVLVSIRMDRDVAEFRVEDDGPGIAPEFHKRIFAIFETLRCRDECDSSGVGLSIVQKSVERAGGKIWVESCPPRRGTIFRFTWPEAAIVTVPARAARIPSLVT